MMMTQVLVSFGQPDAVDVKIDVDLTLLLGSPERYYEVATESPERQKEDVKRIVPKVTENLQLFAGQQRLQLVFRGFSAAKAQQADYLDASMSKLSTLTFVAALPAGTGPPMSFVKPLQLVKTTSVQNMSPPLGDKRSPDCADSSGAAAACCRSANMKIGMVTSWFSLVECGGADAVGNRAASRRLVYAPATHTPDVLELELTLNQERDDDREQRHSFDERREDDRARLDACGHLRLTRHSVHRLPSETSDTDARADYGETRTNAGAQHCPRARVLAGERGCSLKQRKHGYHFVFPFYSIVICHARGLPVAVRHRGSRPNGLLQPARPDTYTGLSAPRVSAPLRGSIQ